MWYVGMDVHLKSSSGCVLDEQGHRVVQKMIRGPWPKLVECPSRKLNPSDCPSRKLHPCDPHQIHFTRWHQLAVSPPWVTPAQGTSPMYANE